MKNKLKKYIKTWCWTKESNIHFIFASNDTYEKQAANLSFLVSDMDFKTIEHTILPLTGDFANENQDILNQPRGAGYWLWKPYIILEKLKEVEDGDVVFYLDAGDSVTGDVISFIIEKSKQEDIILTKGAYRNDEWTHKECFQLMNCDSEKYYDAIQVEAGIIVVKKTKKSIRIIEEWLRFCQNPYIITDNDRPQFKAFKEHRHDQSILTNICVKYNLYSSDEMRRFVTCNVKLIDLEGVTYLIPVFYDSTERKRNLDLTLNSLTGRVIVGEQLGERFSYTRHTNTYVRFPYTEFHRTKMLNEMSKIAETNIIVICDADVIVPIEQIYEAVRLIRQDGYDCIYPHDQFVKLSKEESITYETKGVLPDKAGDRSHGGMIFFNKESFFKGGMENEKFICWGLEDLERVNRFIKLGFRLKRIEGKLYHLWHPRGFNSSDINPHYKGNVKEYHKVKAMNKEQLTKYIKTWKR